MKFKIKYIIVLLLTLSFKVTLAQNDKVESMKVAFITKEIKINNQKKLCAFIPTTPNPTSGYLLMFNEEDVIEANISVDEAIKLILSGGLIQPKENLST